MAEDDAAIEITYRSADMRPPLFVAGSFSNPPWTPLEMKHTETTSGEHVFTKAVLAKPGTTIQYKFRVGLGDWWVLDESLPIVTDSMGNRNNLLRIIDHKSAIAEKPPTPPPDSPPLRTIDVSQSNLQSNLREPLPSSALKGPVRSLKQELGDPLRSDASTPDFVRTTIEVADSAAQIDRTTPEPEVSDEEAGRVGLRRLSSTPISEVADTAAEVADTAEVLDSSIDFPPSDIGPEFPHERPGEDDNGQDIAPLFAYEVAGGYDRPLSVSGSGSEYGPETYPPHEQDEEPEFDPKDPTLERFPSNREEILERVRTIETGLDEDRPTFEGFPPSPVVSPGRKSSVDLTGDFFSISPTASSSRLQPSRRPESHKHSVSRDSLVLDSAPSLQCIVEEAPVDDQQGSLLPKVTETRSLSFAVSPKTAPLELPVALHGSPIIVVHGTDAADSSNIALSTATDGHPASLSEPEQDGRLSPTAAREGVIEQQRSGTPASHQSTGIEAAKNPNWFSAFVRLIFVDWLGSFLGRLFRWRRAE